MDYILKPSHFFLEQIDELSNDAAILVEEKLKLAKINPFRYKRIQGYNLFLFRIRFEENRKKSYLSCR